MVKYYFGELYTEQFLCSHNSHHIPNKGEFIFYNNELYKVVYTLYDIDRDEICAFVRMTVEEDY